MDDLIVYDNSFHHILDHKCSRIPLELAISKILNSINSIIKIPFLIDKHNVIFFCVQYTKINKSKILPYIACLQNVRKLVKEQICPNGQS